MALLLQRALLLLKEAKLLFQIPRGRVEQGLSAIGDTVVIKQAFENVRTHSKVRSLCQKDYSLGYPNYLPLCVDERTTTVARIKRNVQLQKVLVTVVRDNPLRRIPRTPEGMTYCNDFLSYFSDSWLDGQDRSLPRPYFENCKVNFGMITESVNFNDRDCFS
ncbi:MAG: hypothetical protein RMK93_06395 [Bacteroidota bacterium]|nr:hypothetical protein [Bacteroidota bacterium]